MKKNRIFMILFFVIFLSTIAIIFCCLKNMFYKIKADVNDIHTKGNIIALNVGDTVETVYENVSDTSCNIERGHSFIPNLPLCTGDSVCRNNYKIAILGDLNSNGTVTGSDISYLYYA